MSLRARKFDYFQFKNLKIPILSNVVSTAKGSRIRKLKSSMIPSGMFEDVARSRNIEV